MIVAVVVYNRYENIKRWIRCWKGSDTEGSELIIIHNYYGEEKEKEKYKKLCNDNQISYVPRNGPGFDIGAFQDVCRERLPSFDNDWESLLWITDDVIPMTKDFISPFVQKIKDQKVGVACMEISPSVTNHIRTTGFAIRKEVARKLTFPADPVSTKQHCYEFEHRGRNKILYAQILGMGLKAEMVERKERSPLYDTGYWKRLDRMAEHEAVFPPENPKSDKVVFICPIYNMYPQILSSLICQTHKNWELILIHNGPCSSDNQLPTIIKEARDIRVTFIQYPEETGKWGHYLRQWALNEIREERLGKGSEYICVTNADNYLIPVFIEFMLKGFKASPTAAAVYCSDMVHNYKAWQVIPCRPDLGFIDCSGVIVRKEIAVEIGWRDTESHSSDFTYFSDIMAKYGRKSFQIIRGCLLVHN